jgi:hypothetical protein
VTDDAAAFAAAIALAEVNGKKVFVPSGVYIINTALTISNAVSIEGEGFEEGPAPAGGSWITVSNSAIVPFTVTGVSARGTRFTNIAVYQPQPAEAPAWVPTAYQPFFRIIDAFGGVDFVDVFFLNITKGIDCINSGRLYLRRVKGQVFDYLLSLDECYDVPMFDDIHIWPFGSSNNDVLAYQQANTDVFKIARADTPMWGKVFVYAARSVFRFLDTGEGVCTRFAVNHVQGDAVKHCVWIDSTADDVTGHIHGIDIQGEDWNNRGNALSNSSGILIEGNDARLMIGSLRCEYQSIAAVYITGGGNKLDIGSLRATTSNVAFDLAGVLSGNANYVNVATPPFIEGTTLRTASNAVLSYGAFASTLGQVGWNFSRDTSASPERIVMSVSGSASQTVDLNSAGDASTISLGIDGGRILRASKDAGGNTTLNAKSGVGGFVVLVECADANADLYLTPKGSGKTLVTSPLSLQSYTTATRPNAPDYAGSVIYVSDASAGNKLQYSDGANWIAAG